MKTGICTVGTSLQSNCRRVCDVEKPTHKQLVNFLNESDLIQASAESNTIQRLENEEILQPGDRLIFLHSDTEEGKACSAALQEYYSWRGYETQTAAVKGLTYDHKEFANRGLTALVDKLLALVSDYNQGEQEVLLIATGGFKAEIAYATMTGALLGVSVYYIHEFFAGLVEMPPLPIAIDYAFVAEYEEMLVKLDEMPAQEEWNRFVMQWRRQGGRPWPKRFKHLFFQKDGIVTFSAAGELIYRTYLDQLTHLPVRRVQLSANAKKQIEGFATASKKRIDDLLLRLLHPSIQATAEVKNNSDLFVFPRGPRPERIFFFRHEGELYVCEIASHADKSCESLLGKGVWRKEYDPRQFTPYDVF